MLQVLVGSVPLASSSQLIWEHKEQGTNRCLPKAGTTNIHDGFGGKKFQISFAKSWLHLKSTESCAVA